MNHEALGASPGALDSLCHGVRIPTAKGWRTWTAGILLAISLPAVSLPAVAEDPPANDLPATAEQVRCPDCDSKGKSTCPSCDGRGEIWRPCAICKGSGQKPCPVCSKDNRGAGRVTCGYCGGKGTVGAAAKTCPRCDAAQTLSCDTCSGRGTVSCRKEVFDKICPVCRFAGKVTCPTCEGTLWVAPSLLEARRQAQTRPDAAETKEAGPQREEEAEQEAEVPSEAQLLERHKRLSKDCESHFNIFWLDQSPKVAAWKSEAYRLERKLREAGAASKSTALEELAPFIQRTTHFQKRWSELRELYVAEREAYVKLQGNWKDRAASVAAATPRQKPEVEEQWNKRIDLLLRILEKHSAPLSEQEPQWISKEVGELEFAWKRLKPRSEADLAAAATASDKAATESKRAQRSKVAKAGAATGRPSRGKKQPQEAGVQSAREDDDPSGSPSDEIAMGNDPSLEKSYDLFLSSREKNAESLGGESGADHRAKKDAKPPEDPPPSTLPYLLFWALGSIAVLSALFAVLHLRRKKAWKGEEDLQRAQQRQKEKQESDQRHFHADGSSSEDALSSTHAPTWPR